MAYYNLNDYWVSGKIYVISNSVHLLQSQKAATAYFSRWALLRFAGQNTQTVIVLVNSDDVSIMITPISFLPADLS